MLSNLLRRETPKIAALDLVTRERPALPSGQEPLQPEKRDDGGLLEEYSQLTKSLGLSNPHIDADLRVEAFKTFLRQKDWTIFALLTVIAYMDKKAAEESAVKAGWHWRPLRAKDNIKNARFGQEAFHRSFQGGMFSSAEAARQAAAIPDQIQAASDYYFGPHEQPVPRRGNAWDDAGSELRNVPASAEPYDKLVPIHALRKVAAIENEFRGPVSFFVCDYAPAPHIEHPDPFLMAVVDNARLAQGVGRFVIDFWDEPGFGLDKQLGL